MCEYTHKHNMLLEAEKMTAMKKNLNISWSLDLYLTGIWIWIPILVKPELPYKLYFIYKSAFSMSGIFCRVSNNY